MWSCGNITLVFFFFFYNLTSCVSRLIRLHSRDVTVFPDLSSCFEHSVIPTKRNDNQFYQLRPQLKSFFKYKCHASLWTKKSRCNSWIKAEFKTVTYSSVARNMTTIMAEKIDGLVLIGTFFCAPCVSVEDCLYQFKKRRLLLLCTFSLRKSQDPFLLNASEKST